MKNRYCTILLIALIVLLAPVVALAISFPHVEEKGVTCDSCHAANLALGTTGYDNMCVACHYDPLRTTKRFTVQDPSNPYVSLAEDISLGRENNKAILRSSHNWQGSDTNGRAGAVSTTLPAMSVDNVNISNTILCVRCHAIHGPRSSATNSPPFLRVRNDKDQMCMDCHRTRDTKTHMTGSHPINMNYTSHSVGAKLHPEDYRFAPITTGVSKIKLYNGVVLCTTCHGIHYSDSRSNHLQTASNYENLSASSGMLLRVNARGKTPQDPNICTNCHTNKVSHNKLNQNVQCNDCHAGHVEFDGNATTNEEKKPNVFILRRYMNISTPYGKVVNKRTFYRYTSAERKEMFLGARTSENDPVGICQVCHYQTDKFKTEHWDENANQLRGDHGPTQCITCHNHRSNDWSATCTSCHGYPPALNRKGGGTPGGYAVWSGVIHKSYSSPTGRLDESRTPHTTHVGNSYSFNCKECHNGNNHNDGQFQEVFRSAAGTIVSTFGAVPAYNTPTNYDCSNMYCHSNAQAGVARAYKTVNWVNGKDTITTNNQARCRSCHGDKTTVDTDSSPALSGAHKKHAATAEADYACQNCHAETLASFSGFDNNSGLIIPARKHVNGTKNISYKFPNKYNNTLNSKVAGSAYNPNTQSCGKSGTYGTVANVYCHSNGLPKITGGFQAGNVTPLWNDPATGKCGACHSVLASTPPIKGESFGVISSAAHFKHLSSIYGPKLQYYNAPNACVTCHQTFTSEATHVDGAKTPDTMPGSNCQKCHGDPQQGSLPIWTRKNTRIACTQCHPIWDKYSAARMPNGVAAPKQINYSTSGHGQRISPYNTYNSPKKIVCLDCHDQNSAHISNPTELGVYKRLIVNNYTAVKVAVTTFGNVTTHRRGGANNACGKCHWEGQSAQKRVMFTHVTSVSEAVNNNPTMACAKCHDVHGSTNSHMIRSTFVFKPGSSVFIAYSSPYFTVYSSPNSTVVKSRTPRTGNLKFIDPNTNNGICQVCHTKTMHFLRGRNEALHGPAGGINTNTNTSIVSHRNMDQKTNCLSCHSHNPSPTSPGNYAFYPFGSCDGCHGYPPLPKSYVKGIGNYSSGGFEDYTGGGGSHIFAGHIPKSATADQSWNLCSSCHSESDHLSVPAFSQVKVSINPAYKFNSDPAIMAKYTSNRLGGTDHITGTCSNVSCHFQRTPKWGTP